MDLPVGKGCVTAAVSFSRGHHHSHHSALCSYSHSWMSVPLAGLNLTGIQRVKEPAEARPKAISRVQSRVQRAENGPRGVDRHHPGNISSCFRRLS